MRDEPTATTSCPRRARPTAWRRVPLAGVVHELRMVAWDCFRELSDDERADL